jgi:hypothetical protein
LHKKILRATGGKELFTKNTLPPVAAKYFLNLKALRDLTGFIRYYSGYQDLIGF